MNCQVVKDLIPLYIDHCCSAESSHIVKEHIASCDSCNTLYEELRVPYHTVSVCQAPKTISKLNSWKASVLQSVLFLLSFIAMTVGVALEARSPEGTSNGFWAVNLIIPATGFLLSLTNWYFVRLYTSRKQFSTISALITPSITLCAYVWAWWHYQPHFASFDILQEALLTNSVGIALTIGLMILSKLLSDRYAEMLGKE